MAVKSKGSIEIDAKVTGLLALDALKNILGSVSSLVGDVAQDLEKFAQVQQVYTGNIEAQRKATGGLVSDLDIMSGKGTNSQGNAYSTPGGTNSSGGSSYHYSNSNGSYYYANDNGTVARTQACVHTRTSARALQRATRQLRMTRRRGLANDL